MPPIRKGDGTPVEPKGVSQIRTGDGRILFDGPGIPDTRVSRPEDEDNLTDFDNQFGIEVSVSQDWPDFDGRISANVSGFSTAYIFEQDETQIASVDISGLSNGDVFTFEGVDLKNGNNYLLAIDNDGANYDPGFYDPDEGELPFVSDDGNLEIVGGVNIGGSTGALYNIVEVGNLTD